MNPELRFKDEKGNEYSNWDEKTMRDISTVNQGLQIPISQRYKYKGDNRYFYITNEVLNKGSSAQKYYIENPQESVIANKDDILMTRTGNTGIAITNIHGVFHNNFFKINYNRNIMTRDFLFSFLSQEKTRKKLLVLAGASTIPDLKHKSFYTLKVNYPCLKEQEKIANLLSDIDEKIEKQAILIEKLKKTKEAMLVKMFPQGESKVPEIRFDGFNDDWEFLELKQLAEFNPKSTLPSIFEYVDLESVVGITMVSHRKEIKATAPSRAQRVAQKGDLFYQTVRPYQKNNYLFDMDANNFVFSTGYAQLRPFYDGYFLICLVQQENFVSKVLDNCTGTSYPAINSTTLSQIRIKSPKQIDEQYKIGSFFSKLDKEIELNKQKYNKLYDVKKALLSKLFPKKEDE